MYNFKANRFKNLFSSPAFALEMGTGIPTPAIGNSFQGTLGKKYEVDADDLTQKNNEFRKNLVLFYWAAKQIPME